MLIIGYARKIIGKSKNLRPVLKKEKYTGVFFIIYLAIK